MSTLGSESEFVARNPIGFSRMVGSYKISIGSVSDLFTWDILQLVVTLVLMFITLVQTRSNRPARKRPNPWIYGDFVEAVFRPEVLRIFFPMISGQFQPENRGS